MTGHGVDVTACKWLDKLGPPEHAFIVGYYIAVLVC